MKSDEERIEKEKRWAQLETKVDRTVDRLSKRIDPGIKESIIALWALGFTTSASCEGHLERVKICAPWIDIGKSWSIRSLEQGSIKERILLQIAKFLKKVSPLLDNGLEIHIHSFPSRNDKKMIRVIKRKNLKEQMRLMELLDEFYEGREISSDTRLTLIMGNRLTSGGSRFQEIRSKEEREEKFKQYQQEMRAFTDFLKNKFFGP